MKNFGNNIEQNLILRSRVGDTRAFGDLCRMYKKPLFTYLVRMTGSREAGEDAMQETLIKVWKGIKKYKDQNKFSSWLFTIAHNTALDFVRSEKQSRNHAELTEHINGNGFDNPHSIVVAKETESIIQRFVEALPGSQREVFLLRQHGGLSFKEIAELKKEPVNTILGHMHYAVKKLKQALKEEHV